MYDLNAYGKMMADRVRMDAYVAALRHAVNTDSVVLEIGTGAGVFALLACQYGARHVYAIETSDAIEVARAAAVANGYAERITFFQELSTKVTLPERADIIISDLRGVVPYFHTNITSLIDARQRHLKPGGVMIPRRDQLQIAVVNAPELYHQYTAPWLDHGYEFDWHMALQKVLNTFSRARVSPEQILLPAQCGATLDYTTVEETSLRAEVRWTASSPVTAHGLIVWFDTTLIDGVGFSSGPGESELVYGNGFFPWLQPVDIAVGDSIEVKLNADLVGLDYVWRWETIVLDQGRPEQIKVSFKQSTFFGMPLSPASLRKRATGYIPSLNEDGQIEQFILARMTGEASLNEIAGQLLDHYHTRFATQEEALTVVREVSQKYSR